MMGEVENVIEGDVAFDDQGMLAGLLHNAAQREQVVEGRRHRAAGLLQHIFIVPEVDRVVDIRNLEILAAIGIEVENSGQERGLGVSVEIGGQVIAKTFLLHAARQLIAVLVHEVDGRSRLQSGAQLGLVLAAVPDDLECRLRVRGGVVGHDLGEHRGLRLRLVPHRPEHQLRGRSLASAHDDTRSQCEGGEPPPRSVRKHE